MFRVAFVEPRIPPNTGNAIRMVAATGCELHLIGPLGFELDDARLRRAGLDYHDLASVTVHPDLASAWPVLTTPQVDGGEPARVYAFTGHSSTNFASVAFRAGDVLMFGSEPDGLPPDVLADPRVTARVRIPMLAGRRSLNLSNSAAIAVYEAWRQHGYAGGA